MPDILFSLVSAEVRRNIRNGCLSTRLVPASDRKGFGPSGDESWLMAWISTCPSMDLQSHHFSPLPLLSDELSVWLLSIPFHLTPFILFHFSVAPFLDPIGCGSSCLLYHESVDFLLWTYGAPISCDLSLVFFCMWVYTILYLVLLLCGARKGKQRKIWDQSSISFTSGYII